MLHLVENQPESEDLTKTANLVTDMALVISGWEIKDYTVLSTNVYQSVGRSLGLTELEVSPMEVDISDVELEEADKTDGTFLEDLEMD